MSTVPQFGQCMVGNRKLFRLGTILRSPSSLNSGYSMRVDLFHESHVFLSQVGMSKLGVSPKTFQTDRSLHEFGQR